ncbi:MAG: DUF4249 domain-containing protein [Bacteroidales bacterium]|nr:DUF4249 domain-containing protein [Bacteroidales bacterium]
MKVNSKLVPVIFFFLTMGCIEPFTPDIDDHQPVLVIEGNITNEEGYQYITISRSSIVGKEEHYFPERLSDVIILDDKGNSFNCDEYSGGHYRCWMGQEYLTAGTQYKVNVKTQDGREYESDFDELLACPPIDKIYYEVQERATYDPQFPEYGIQLYVETDATGNFVDNFRWKIIETWEYHSEYLLEYYYDGDFKEFFGPKDSLFYCWKTEPVNEIYTISTKQLSSKNLKVPVRFVSNQTNRLKYGYTALVKQYSLSDAAFEYWDKIQKQVQETGGLYETQPLRIFGNIRCISHPEEIALGFFYATSLQEKRIFVNEDFDFYINDYLCAPLQTDAMEFFDFLRTLTRADFPYWILKTPTRYDLADKACFDCALRGGTHIKPEFWQQ